MGMGKLEEGFIKSHFIKFKKTLTENRMKRLLQILQVGIALLLIIALFFWAGLHATGHKIPVKTDITAFLNISVLTLLFIILKYIRRKTDR